ncbi:hypothetical protein DDB_G0277005 [Dictyostelium discoideum AX4]|uniref:B box-type domain-containing protein n=1 Tax=Dictyostelium discoideum TaxID=44689 RepID=Q550U3_DICDI|nr:hypothetical protein DDB_G0277005 [Dictyostelium discoideum AX4]EAL69004.1 hypothetical protein DDB_G0277005 [Dictyostelium discoideum AX4]|eukprot:XP_642839.1 hypothetical protein DDB_G0277005 [Dictyostelium discoideum AX4]
MNLPFFFFPLKELYIITKSPKDTVFFCLDCKLKPCCTQCTSNKGEHHGHRTDSLELVNTLSVLEHTQDIMDRLITSSIKDKNELLKILVYNYNNEYHNKEIFEKFNEISKFNDQQIFNNEDCFNVHGDTIKTIKFNNLNFNIYKEGDILNFKENVGIEFKDNSIKNQLPSSVMLLDGFNQKLTPGILPDHIKWLHLGDIKQELIVGSIPNTVTHVTLFDGFNLKLTPGILPNCLESLYLGNIGQEFMIGSIPNTVKKVKISENFKHQIEPFVSKNEIIIKLG